MAETEALFPPLHFKKRERGTAATVIENVVHILLIVSIWCGVTQ